MEKAYKELRRKVLFEVLDKYPDAPNLTTARILYRDHSEFFKSVEQARTMVRLYRGANGLTNRSRVKNHKYYKDET